MRGIQNFIMLVIIICLCAVANVEKVEANNQPSWENNGERFIILHGAFQGEAVKDTETGLVWERSPSSNALDVNAAGAACINKAVGNKKGWRLPHGHELATLVDPTQISPALPSGHPFLNIQLDTYWGEWQPNSSKRLVVNMNDGGAGPHNIGFRPVWCVRAP